MVRIECTDIVLLTIVVIYSIRAICKIVVYDAIRMNQRIKKYDND